VNPYHKSDSLFRANGDFTMLHRIIAIALATLWNPIELMAQGPSSTEAIRAVAEVYDGLPRMLNISWREGPEYPLGIQDSAFGALDGQIISCGGFSRHAKDVVEKYPDAFDGQPNGFTKLTFLFDPRKAGNGWARIVDAPGPPRQAAATAVVGSDFYMIGGLSYTEPNAYTSTYRLRLEPDGTRKWEMLNCQLPWPICEAGTAVVGDKIYLFGGADYYKRPSEKNEGFYSASGRSDAPVGRALLVLDSSRTEAGWQRLQDIPGTPRFDAAGGAVGGKVYVLGGVYEATTDKFSGYHNVIDSWVYDPESAQWSRLPDAPQGANRRVVVFKDRYLILLGGYRYGTTWNLDGTVSEVLTSHEKAFVEMKDHIEATVLVFDARTARYGMGDPLLDKTSYPMAAVANDTIYCLGGEGGNRLWHPATFQIGKVEEIPGRK
jgi:N-acetylneuraminic acid mutarotase